MDLRSALHALYSRFYSLQSPPYAPRSTNSGVCPCPCAPSSVSPLLLLMPCPSYFDQDPLPGIIISLARHKQRHGRRKEKGMWAYTVNTGWVDSPIRSPVFTMFPSIFPPIPYPPNPILRTSLYQLFHPSPSQSLPSHPIPILAKLEVIRPLDNPVVDFVPSLSVEISEFPSYPLSFGGCFGVKDVSGARGIE